MLLLAGCNHQQCYDSSFLAMGTRIDISVMSNDPAQAAQAITTIEHSMLQWSKDWYPWGTASGELKQLNASLASGQSMRVSAELSNLLQQSKRLSITSNGYFDPAVAPMVKAWGFDDMDHTSSELPNEQQLAAWVDNHATMQDVIIENNIIHSQRRDVQLDLGAIAKGYAEDLSMQQLQRLNIVDAAINIGGQVRILGKVDKQSREVQIRDPRLNTSIASLTLNDSESISTSGDYERFVIVNGQRIHHLLDPHTGKPVTHTQMVTVVANTATLADAASTAIMAADTNWRQIAKQLDISQVLRVDATGEIQTTAAMYARLRWNPPALQTHHLVQVN